MVSNDFSRGALSLIQVITYDTDTEAKHASKEGTIIYQLSWLHCVVHKKSTMCTLKTSHMSVSYVISFYLLTMRGYGLLCAR